MTNSAVVTTDNPRTVAFLSRDVPNVFDGVVGPRQVWLPDPFDVVEIHEDARRTFDRPLLPSSAHLRSRRGRILLVSGPSGCGKTHLMRAFRAATHDVAGPNGYFVYSPMVAGCDDYLALLRASLADGFAHPYGAATGGDSAWGRLGAHLLSARPVREHAERLLRDDLSDDDMHGLVVDLSDRLLDAGIAGEASEDLVRALLYRQRPQVSLQHRINRLLRGDALAEHDWRRITAIAPGALRDHREMIRAVAALVRDGEGGPLVIAVDQIEQATDERNGHRFFGHAMGELCQLGDEIPNLVVVLASLQMEYDRMREALLESHRIRIEHDPEPVQLEVNRSAEELRAMIARRLASLFEQAGLPNPAMDRLHPVPEDVPDRLQGAVNRRALSLCHAFRERCIAAGKIVAWADEVPRSDDLEPAPEPDGHETVIAAWNAVLTRAVPPDDDDDEAMLDLLGWAIDDGTKELPTGWSFAVRPVAGRAPLTGMLEVDLVPAVGRARRFLLGLCNRNAQGGGLARQVEAVRDAPERVGRSPVAVRAGSFRFGPKTQITALLNDFMARHEGRKLHVEDADWRTMTALRTFLADPPEHLTAEAIDRWRRHEMPLASMASFEETFGISELTPFETRTSNGTDPAPGGATPPSPPDREGAPAVTPTKPPADDDLIGDPERIPVGVLQTRSGTGEAMSHPKEALARHTGVLGQTGSGKTVLACHLVEHLLLRGVPVVLVDRKGDLATYAAEEAWRKPLEGEDVERRTRQRDRLRERIRVDLFTPGAADGRPLALPVLPRDARDLPPAEQDAEAEHAKSVLLAGVAGQKRQRFESILYQAILIALRRHENPTLDHLLDLLQPPDDELVSQFAFIQPKQFEQLAADLEIRRRGPDFARLFRGEPIDVVSMLRPDADTGRVPLNIIATTGLDDDAAVSWVALFLGQIRRYAKRHPRGHLQAVIMFDEADLYLPAVREPATKKPMIDLLKRARSAGIGIMLATQSPGDLDYTCREQIGTWFVGSVPSERSIEKLRIVLGKTPLPTGGKGRFLLAHDGQVRDLQTPMNLVLPTQRTMAEIESLAATTRAAATISP